VALATIDRDFVRDIPSRHRDFNFLYARSGRMRSRLSACFSIPPYNPCRFFLSAVSTHVRLCYLTCRVCQRCAILKLLSFRGQCACLAYWAACAASR
jgi:hypothetical protein